MVSLNSCGQEDAGAQACGEFGEVLGAMCDAMGRCPGTFYPFGYRNRAECMDFLCFATTCSIHEVEEHGVERLMLKERVPEIDAAHKNECIQWLEQASCEDIRRGQESPCEHLIIDFDGDGSQNLAGEPCVSDADCGHDLYCSQGGVDEQDAVRFCSICAPLPGRGEPCLSGWRCDEGLHCGDDRRCVPSFVDGQACTDHAQCLSGFCDPSIGICAPVGQPGDPCAKHEDCLSGAFCGSDQRCEEVRQIGESCTEAAQCPNAECDLQVNRCGRPNGAPCDTFADQCHGGYCDPNTAICVAGRAIDEYCERDQECASRRCDWERQVCVESCSSSEDCGPDRYCEPFSMSCAPAREDGFGCSADEECLSGSCSVAGRCGPPPEIGDPCSSSVDCLPIGYCDAGACTAYTAPGEPCVDFEECQQPFFCIEERCRSMNLTCRPGRPGERCTFLQFCDETSFCDRSSFTCVHRATVGEPCESDDMCVSPSYCGFDAGLGACTMPAAEGESCSASRRCEHDLTCADSVCRRLREEGEPCASTDECMPGLRCEGGERGTFCIDTPEGRPCDIDDDCPEWFHCDWNTISCQRNPGLGGDCFRDEDCARGFYCESIDGCQPWKTLGEDCSSAVPCADPFYCEVFDWVCVPRLELGQSCFEDRDECAADLFCRHDPSVGASTCQALLDLREPCNSHEHCRSGVCDEEFGCLASAECKMPDANAAM